MSPVADEVRVVWEPLAGSQPIFLSCPILECLFEGTRGPGKTDALLMDYARDVGRGHGQAWFGILFRQTYKQLEDVIRKSNRWFRQIFPEARFSKGPPPRWEWPTGETLMFAHMDDPEDYWNYHGWEIPWIGWEELTNWPDLECYHRMKACCRTSVEGVPRRIRATANPWGVGHHAVKMYFIDPAPPGVVIESPEGLRRVRVRGHWSENKALLRAQPDYPSFIAASATSTAQRKAWLDGSWDVVAGGRFDDVWDRQSHVIDPWVNDDGTLNIPSSWRIDRAYDWGSSAPFSVGWWAESDGTLAPDGSIWPSGSVVRIAEWYGWDGRTPNVGLRMSDKEIALGIVEREKRLGIRDRVRAGAADAQIFQLDAENKSIATTMAKYGVRFTEADKRPGSRVTGWAAIWNALNARRERDPEAPWLAVFNTCRQFVRTVPTLPRDKKKPDDVDTDAEDHIGDETRYRMTAPKRTARVTQHTV